jgi:integrase
MYCEVSEKVGFGKRHPHTARHTYACLLITKGFKLEDIQLYMGHSSRVTTEIYVKLAFTLKQKEKYLQLFL